MTEPRLQERLRPVDRRPRRSQCHSDAKDAGTCVIHALEGWANDR